MKPWARWIAVALPVALAGSGCLFHRLEQPPRAPAPLPERLSQEFGNPQERPKLDEVSSAVEPCACSAGKANQYYELQEITLTNTQIAGKAVQFDYFLPNETRTANPGSGSANQRYRRRPAILILPIMGGTNYDLEGFFAHAFARRGFVTLILHRPDIKAEVRELEEIDGLLRQSVEDARSAIDWLLTQPQVDGERIGLFGVSLGAIRGTLVLAVDHRVRAGVLGLVGGDLPYILTHTAEKGLVRERDKMLAARHMSLREAEEKLRQIITCDPLQVAPAVDPSRVLMVIAAFDGSIPASKGWELRRKLGNPATIQLFSGHYSSVIYAPYLRWKAGRFFEAQLGGATK